MSQISNRIITIVRRVSECLLRDSQTMPYSNSTIIMLHHELHPKAKA